METDVTLFSPGHQDIDNAGDLDTVGGLKPTLELLQHEESKVRQSALWVIGSTVQHNTKTQVYDSATLIGSRCKRAADPGGRLLMRASAHVPICDSQCPGLQRTS